MKLPSSKALASVDQCFRQSVTALRALAADYQPARCVQVRRQRTPLMRNEERAPSIHNGRPTATRQAVRFLRALLSATACARRSMVSPLEHPGYSPRLFTLCRRRTHPVLVSHCPGCCAALFDSRPTIRIVVRNFLSSAVDAQLLKIAIEEVRISIDRCERVHPSCWQLGFAHASFATGDWVPSVAHVSG